MPKPYYFGGTLAFPGPRPDRNLVLRLSRYYSLVVASLVSLVIFLSAYRYVQLWVFVAIGLYWIYQIGKGVLEERGLLGRTYTSEDLQIARAVLLLAVITFFLLFLYNSPLYIQGQSSGDTLWLLYILAIFIVSQYSNTRSVIVVLALSIIGLFLVYAVSFPIITVELLLDCLSRTIWLTLLAIILHVLIRFADFRADNLRALHELREEILKLHSAEDEARILQEITNSVAGAFGYPYVNIFKPKPELNGDLLCIASASKRRRNLANENFVLPAGKGIISYVVREGKPYLTNDVSHAPEDHNSPDPHYFRHDAFPDTTAEYALPLKAGGRIAFVLDIQHRQKDAFTDYDQEVISLMADQISSVLDLKKQAGWYERIGELIREVSSGYFSQRELQQTLDAIAKAAQEQLGADLVILYGHNHATGETILGAKRGSFYAEEHLDHSIEKQREKMPDFISAPKSYYFDEDVMSVDNPLFEPDKNVELRGFETFYIREKIISRATLRLDADLGCVGLMFLNFRTRRSFQEQEALFHTFAHLAALALQKAQLQEEKILTERAALASLLHQDIKDKLTIVMGHIRYLLHDQKLSDESRSTADKARQDMEQIIDSVRYLHRTQMKLPGGLASEVNDQLQAARQIFHRTGFKAEWHGDTTLVPADVSVSAATIVRDLLLNAKHGEAAEVKLSFTVTPGMLSIYYEDDGKGFGTHPTLSKHKLTGLAFMQEEARKVGGEVKIIDPSRLGARIQACLPFDQTAS